MKRFMRFVFSLCLTAVFLTGCGQAGVPEEIETSAIAVSGKGKITAYLVADFDKAYYDLSELTSMATEEAAEFNAAKQAGDVASVVVEKVELLGEAKVKLTYQFDSWKVYSEFNEGMLFYGTVKEAAEKGYTSGAVLKSVKDGSVMSEEELLQNGDKMLIVTDAAADIYCPEKVTHVSDGASLNEDGSVAVQTENIVYILLK